MEYYVYILYSASLDRFYVGQTQDLEARLQRHNSGRNKSTKAGVPWEMVLFETCVDRTEAVRKETKIKNLGGKRYLQMIGKVFNPEQPGSVS
ncbi:MAG: GIY-YIG nuclease family protein [Cyclobacterium sp.]|uniref:GIY-YIG nuclease family protein n=1 Tax=unclassified Cyclobacterium TaxID=2615055 RepID=UPI0013D51EBB|nr:GIY-YIG nuclease family protein [Cyclobacterium sp. SYSU L10401]